MRILARLLFSFSFFEVPLSCFESHKQGVNKMEFPARPLDKLEPLHASLKAFLSSITSLERKKRSLAQWASDA